MAERERAGARAKQEQGQEQGQGWWALGAGRWWAAGTVVPPQCGVDKKKTRSGVEYWEV